jgi:dephospho-CoA kinase
VYCVGLTGNIASGKSTVAAYFANLGVDVISADKIAKELTTSTQPAFMDILNHFGQAVLTKEGELDRRYLRQLIFKNPAERLWLEQYLHPLIRKQVEIQAQASNSPYCLIEIPLLRDRALYPYLNRVLLVEAETEQQIERLAIRDNSSKADALAILATQADASTLHKLADDILINSGSLEELREKIAGLHMQYFNVARMDRSGMRE